MEGTCHGSGVDTDLDKGAPTYFRYDVEKTSSGQAMSPGSAHAVLYSLQKIGGRFCDFKTYTDTEVWFFSPIISVANSISMILNWTPCMQVLIAMDDVMEWIETVLMEVDGVRGSEYDISFSKVFLNLDRTKITTTTRTTNLDTVWFQIFSQKFQKLAITSF